eukprot:4568000-Alexandrium_andersonii.AAC.1
MPRTPGSFTSCLGRRAVLRHAWDDGSFTSCQGRRKAGAANQGSKPELFQAQASKPELFQAEAPNELLRRTRESA